MKKYICIITALLSAWACAEPEIGSTPTDGVAPGGVRDVQFKNVPGGADITYTLPDDNDLLYVKANYTLSNGKQMSVRVSMYEDTLRVRGFADELPRTVELVTGDRSKNESAPVPITITPKRSAIYDILDSMDLIEAFGGIVMMWDNQTQSDVVITLLRKTGLGSYEEVNTYYTNARRGRQPVRGMPPEQIEFAVFIRDRWENSTEMLVETLTPRYEVQLTPGTYKEFKMTGDSEISFGWALGYALDGDLTQPWGWFSRPTVEGGVWPARCTIEFNTAVTLSRTRIIQRHQGGGMWEAGNPKKFTLWGSNSPNPDGSYDGWTALKTFTSVKPSGYPSGQYSDEDAYVAINGEDFEMDADRVAPYKYYRFEFTENWGQDNTFINLLEILFWGQP